MQSRMQTGRIVRALVRALVAAGLITAALITGLAHYLVRRTTTPRRSRRPPHYTYTPWEFGIPYRQVRIRQNEDEIDAWYLPQPDERAPCILVLPGHGMNKSEVLGIASALHNDGFACLLLDFRGVGLSTGDVITLGHYETEDAIAAIDWLARNATPESIGVVGYSLGGSVAINVAGLDDRVGAVVSDSAFASQHGILAYQVRRATRMWPAPVLAVAAPMFRRRHHRDYAQFSPVERIHQISPRPLLLIHPDQDTMVPLSDGLQLWEQAREPKELWIASGIGHCGAYFEDREDYCRRVSDFLSRSLRSSGASTTVGTRDASPDAS